MHRVAVPERHFPDPSDAKKYLITIAERCVSGKLNIDDKKQLRRVRNLEISKRAPPSADSEGQTNKPNPLGRASEGPTSASSDRAPAPAPATPEEVASLPAGAPHRPKRAPPGGEPPPPLRPRLRLLRKTRIRASPATAATDAEDECSGSRGMSASESPSLASSGGLTPPPSAGLLDL